MKKCTNCIFYDEKINYCKHFNFKTNSITSASICCKYTEAKKISECKEELDSFNTTQADTLIKSSNKSKRIKKDTSDVIKCGQCSKLFFNTFCSALNKNILNPNKPLRCEYFAKK